MKRSLESIRESRSIVGPIGGFRFCDGGRNYPSPGKCVLGRDTAHGHAEAHQELAAIAYALESIPTTHLRVRHRMQGNGAHHGVACMSQANDLAFLGLPKRSHALAEAQSDQIRQKKPHGHERADACTVASGVFFTLEAGIRRFFPSLCTLKVNSISMQDRPQRLDANTLDNAGLYQVGLQLLQRPPIERLAQDTGWTQGTFNDLRLQFFGELDRPTLPFRGRKQRYPFLVKPANQLPNILFTQTNGLRNLLYSHPLPRQRNDLSPSHCHTILASPKYGLDSLAFGNRQRTYVCTHLSETLLC